MSTWDDDYPAMDALVALGEAVRELEEVVQERGMDMKDAWAVLNVVVPIIRAEALREAAELADVGHGAGCKADPDSDCLGCFREDLLRLAARIDGRKPEE